MNRSSNKKFSKLVVLALFLCLAFLTAYTYAWFYQSSGEISGSITFGKIETTISTMTFSTSNLMPGDAMISANLTATKVANSESYYLLAKITIGNLTYDSTRGTLTSAQQAAAATAFDATTQPGSTKFADYFKSNLTIASGFEYYSAGGYYIYGSSATATKVTTTTPITILDASTCKIPSGMLQVNITGVTGVQYYYKATVSVVVVAIQTANIGTSFSAVSVAASGLI